MSEQLQEESKSEKIMETNDEPSEQLSESNNAFTMLRTETMGKLQEIQSILAPIQDLDQGGNIIDTLANKLVAHRKF